MRGCGTVGLRCVSLRLASTDVSSSHLISFPFLLFVLHEGNTGKHANRFAQVAHAYHTPSFNHTHIDAESRSERSPKTYQQPLSLVHVILSPLSLLPCLSQSSNMMHPPTNE
ncbi:hypothetical protein BU24DRAFT_425557 [Aaosphaeria arxii CBS 175.79]|uniref:Uncharacterized protein n=1 Tax=Aaosphaeria arxii CBS 175.79 TaxID=1450172 RepID=A0A6A5XJC8_9PLEO|nr:uncharacterized protein BU24DRAFT_425557 [Aaosphaeria arxii CBS 175.79]KAF2012969.1 hypothetical protein BU24DRAFT_425557 [Aaosphaeria arxii CBS 175.79]